MSTVCSCPWMQVRLKRSDMATCIRLNAKDNIAVALRPLSRGEVLSVDGREIVLAEDIDFGHKFALCDIREGEDVFKYGLSIGHAIADIRPGDWVHVHNLTTNYIPQRV